MVKKLYYTSANGLKLETKAVLNGWAENKIDIRLYRMIGDMNCEQ